MADIRMTTTVLDDFNRTPENPLTGVPPGSWATMFPGGRGPLATDGGSAGTNASNNIGGIWYSNWERDVFPAGDIEVWGGPVGGQAGAALAGWRFGFVTASSAPGAFDGYLFLREDALGSFTYWRRYAGGNIVADTQGTIYSHQTGAILMCRKIGTTLEAWSTYDTSGATGWTLLNQWTGENTYTGPWKIFIGVEDGTLVGTGWDFMGGGVTSPFKPQIYRWIRA